mmetsp:Transcript_46573/g.141088  ORF Transcript_46573/g.141088 Transcript_46573/m.141088 type:complete len:211 (-) Transcript_46573:601-1233(-)
MNRQDIQNHRKYVSLDAERGTVIQSPSVSRTRKSQNLHLPIAPPPATALVLPSTTTGHLLSLTSIRSTASDARIPSSSSAVRSPSLRLSKIRLCLLRRFRSASTVATASSSSSSEASSSTPSPSPSPSPPPALRFSPPSFFVFVFFLPSSSAPSAAAAASKFHVYPVPGSYLAQTLSASHAPSSPPRVLVTFAFMSPRTDGALYTTPSRT